MASRLLLPAVPDHPGIAGLKDHLVAFGVLVGHCSPSVGTTRGRCIAAGRKRPVNRVTEERVGGLEATTSADFETDEPYILVTLDPACRRQQAGEGWFASVDEVPPQAVSMSVRQIMQ